MTDRDEGGRFLTGHAQPGPGRDSLYDPSMNEQARKLALLGLTDDQVAAFFEVSPSTIDNWKRQYPAFLCSLNQGKIIADANVADSLYRRATGEVIFVEKRVKDKDGNYEIVRLSQQVPADPGAAKLWLTNRRPADWRDKQEVKHSGAVQMGTKEQRDAAVAAFLRADE